MLDFSNQVLAKYCIQVEYISNASLGMTDYPLMVVVRVMWPIFVNFDRNYIFGVGETSHFKCRVLIDTEVY